MEPNNVIVTLARIVLSGLETQEDKAMKVETMEAILVRLGVPSVAFVSVVDALVHLGRIVRDGDRIRLAA